jgi:hypothetical protein
VVCTLAGGAGTPSDSDNVVSVSGLEASHLLSESCCPSLKHRVMTEGSESQKKREKAQGEQEASSLRLLALLPESMQRVS